MIPPTTQQGNTLVTLRGAGLRCRAVSAWADLLAPLLATDPASWSGLVEIKASRVRSTRRGDLCLPGGKLLGVHVKLYRAGRALDVARTALRGPRGLRELDCLLEARSRGLPCVEPLAAGTWAGSAGARSFLITRTVSGQPLPRGSLTPDQARRAGALLRQAHDAGLHARDLHPGNVIQQTDGSLALCDLTSAALAQPLELEERARALAYFCLGLDGGVLDPAAAPLLAAYAASPRCVALAKSHGLRLRAQALAAFGRRALRGCAHTAVHRRRRGPRRYLHLAATPWLDAALRVLEAPPAPAKSGRRGGVTLTDTLAVKERTAAAARRLWTATYWLAFAGVPRPEPVLLQTFRGRGLVVSVRVPGPTLADLARRRAALGELLPLARELGTAVGRLHAHGLRNRDLKLDNLVLDDRSGHAVMIDLDGIHRRGGSDTRGQAADLGRLLAAFRAAGAPGGASTARAFWRGYHAARQCLSRPPNLRRLVPLIAARAAAWARAHTDPGRSGCSGACAASGAASTPGSPKP